MIVGAAAAAAAVITFVAMILVSLSFVLFLDEITQAESIHDDW